MAVSMGANSWESSFNKRHGISSGPDALLGLRPDNNFSTPSIFLFCLEVVYFFYHFFFCGTLWVIIPCSTKYLLHRPIRQIWNKLYLSKSCTVGVCLRYHPHQSHHHGSSWVIPWWNPIRKMKDNISICGNHWYNKESEIWKYFAMPWSQM